MNDLDHADLTRALRAFVHDNTPTSPPPPLAARPVHVRRRPTAWLVAAAVVLLATAVTGGWWLMRAPVEGRLVVLDQAGASSDRLPSTTAEDWVTYADHVLVVTPTDEEEVPPAEDEVQRGEGLIGRQVSLTVDGVLWSRPDPDRPAPDTLSWQVWGWQFEGGPDDRWPVVGSGTARIEPGHTYVVAVSWEDARCSSGDPRVSAQWRPLGGAAVVPRRRRSHRCRGVRGSGPDRGGGEGRGLCRRDQSHPGRPARRTGSLRARRRARAGHARRAGGVHPARALPLNDRGRRRRVATTWPKC